MSQDRLREWARVTGPHEHMVWVGKDVSVADVKAWVRGVLMPEPEIESCPSCGGIMEHVFGCDQQDVAH